MEKMIETVVEDGVARITLNRPHVLNAVNLQMIVQLRAVLSELRHNPDARVLLLTGSGRAFCAGIDLGAPFMQEEEGQADPSRRFRALMDDAINGLMRDLYAFDRPKIAAVNGAAVGGGCGLALVCDMVLAARSSYFLFPFAPRLARVPDMGMTWFLPRLLGRSRALGLAMLGDRLPAAQAEQWGLVWKCVEDEALQGEATALAHRLREGPPRAFAEQTRILDAAPFNSFGDQLDLERDVQAALVCTPNAMEAVRAFREKRPAYFGWPANPTEGQPQQEAQPRAKHRGGGA
ncbi:enoyl-CoA hydratase-related protein [Xanthobacter aminoxidans]|uniref:enoyl-CoA hydratase-related protein n=1 Tax=Xanthobacter aminoxidans TaxID=186280 RepID=UPI00372C556C